MSGKNIKEYFNFKRIVKIFYYTIIKLHQYNERHFASNLIYKTHSNRHDNAQHHLLAKHPALPSTKRIKKPSKVTINSPFSTSRP